MNSSAQLHRMRYLQQGMFGYEPFRMFAHTDNLDSAGYQSVGVGNDITLAFLSSADTVDVASTSANDDDGQTGALTVQLNGLDGSWLETSETFTLNGTTEVAGSTSFLRVNSLQVLTAGGTGTNEGDIWVGKKAATFTGGVPDAGNELYVLETGWNVSNVGQYSIPASQALVLESVAITSQAAASKVVQVRLEARDNTTAGTGLWEVVFEHHLQDGSFAKPCFARFGEKTDLRLRADSSADDAQVGVVCNFQRITDTSRA